MMAGPQITCLRWNLSASDENVRFTALGNQTIRYSRWRSLFQALIWFSAWLLRTSMVVKSLYRSRQPAAGPASRAVECSPYCRAHGTATGGRASQRHPCPAKLGSVRSRETGPGLERTRVGSGQKRKGAPFPGRLSDVRGNVRLWFFITAILKTSSTYLGNNFFC